MPTPPPDRHAPRNPDYTIPRLVRDWFRDSGLVTDKQLKIITKALFDQILAELRSGNAVVLPHIGRFETRTKPLAYNRAPWIATGAYDIVPNTSASYLYRHRIRISWRPNPSNFGGTLPGT